MYYKCNSHDPTHALYNKSQIHHHYRMTENWNMRTERFWILKWTDAADRKIDYTTWYVGQVTKVPTRKLHGYQHKTSPIHPNSASYSTNDTPIRRPPIIAQTKLPITPRLAPRPPSISLF